MCYINFRNMEDSQLSSAVGPPCSLVLADGTILQGRSFGAAVPVEGEVGE